jgi:hypothetical protein
MRKGFPWGTADFGKTTENPRERWCIGVSDLPEYGATGIREWAKTIANWKQS